MNHYQFTERAREVLQLSRDAAIALHHEYVGTEHILLGLLGEEQGVGAAVIQRLHADPQAIREKLLSIVRPGLERPRAIVDLPYTTRARKVFELAKNEVRELGHAQVGTEHLLLGLLAEEHGIAAQVLLDSGWTLQAARNETLRVLETTKK